MKDNVGGGILWGHGVTVARGCEASTAVVAENVDNFILSCRILRRLARNSRSVAAAKRRQKGDRDNWEVHGSRKNG
jgi:hypothetical protein